jgi:hypothetical protein
VVNGDRHVLPLGSSLDSDQGIFYGQPAAGFLGSYDLLFAPTTGERVETRVRVVVGPSLRMALDAPRAGAVAQPFQLAGWAIDLASADGTGIDTLHAWAYPLAGRAGQDRAPIFLGVAETGDARPDVAAIYGAQFERSAYAFSVARLAPGTYDVVVYAHRAATGSFDGVQVVRVSVR